MFHLGTCLFLAGVAIGMVVASNVKDPNAVERYGSCMMRKNIEPDMPFGAIISKMTLDELNEYCKTLL